MSTKHTPGPWRVTLAPRYLNAEVHGKGRQHVAQVWSGRARSMDVVNANARLIAEAPELLWFAEFMAAYRHFFDTHMTPQDAKRIRVAIAKARGE